MRADGSNSSVTTDTMRMVVHLEDLLLLSRQVPPCVLLPVHDSESHGARHKNVVILVSRSADVR